MKPAVGHAKWLVAALAIRRSHSQRYALPLHVTTQSWSDRELRPDQAKASATSAAALAVEGVLEITGGVLSPAASSSLAGPITTMRRYSAARVSLADVAKICRDSGVTVNDVALAAITDSFRAALVRRGEKPRRDSLRTLVPVSIRSNDAANATDNRVSLMLPFLPVDKEDPADQLQAVHRRLTRAKSSGQRQAGGIFIAAVNVVPFSFTAWAVRALTDCRSVAL